MGQGCLLGSDGLVEELALAVLSESANLHQDGYSILYQDTSNTILGGDNSNIFYFHPDPWGNDAI